MHAIWREVNDFLIVSFAWIKCQNEKIDFSRAELKIYLMYDFIVGFVESESMLRIKQAFKERDIRLSKVYGSFLQSQRVELESLSKPEYGWGWIEIASKLAVQKCPNDKWYNAFTASSIPNFVAVGKGINMEIEFFLTGDNWNLSSWMDLLLLKTFLKVELAFCLLALKLKIPADCAVVTVVLMPMREKVRLYFSLLQLYYK